MAKQKGSILTKPDYDEIRRAVREEVVELTSNLPTKKEYFETSDVIIKELKAIREDFAAHKSMHEDLDKDVPDLQHKVKHLYKIFEVEEPVDVTPSF